MMFNKSTPPVLAILVLGFALCGPALACSTDGWTVTSGAVAVGQPFGAQGEDLNNIPRFEEFCALRANGVGHVGTDSPSHNRVRIRFYVFPNLVSTRGVGTPATLLKAFDDNGGAGDLLVSIAFDDGNLIFDATPNGGTQGSMAAAPGWNWVEIDFNTSNGDFNVWLNTDATVDNPDLELAAGSAATTESVQVGLPDGLGTHTGEAYLDTIEMHNETAIGPVVNCNADGMGGINIGDVVALIDEYNFVALAAGTPNCDPTSGGVGIGDVVAMIDVYNNP